MMGSVDDGNGRYIEVDFTCNSKKYIFGENCCKELNKCIADIHKSFSDTISYISIRNAVYLWVFYSVSGEMKVPLCEYVEKSVNQTIAPYTCYFRMPFINFPENRCLTIAGVRIGRMQAEDIAILEKSSKQMPQDNYKSMIFASTTAEGECLYAKELAYEKAQLAVDIIKVNSFLRFTYNLLLAKVDIDRNIVVPPSTLTLSRKHGDDLMNVVTIQRLPMQLPSMLRTEHG